MLNGIFEHNTKRGIFGRFVAILIAIEFQKRGMSDQNLSFFWGGGHYVGTTDLTFLSQSTGISTHNSNYC